MYQFPMGKVKRFKNADFRVNRTWKQVSIPNGKGKVAGIATDMSVQKFRINSQWER